MTAEERLKELSCKNCGRKVDKKMLKDYYYRGLCRKCRYPSSRENLGGFTPNDYGHG